MTIPPFTYKGRRVLLRHMGSRTSSPIWIAEVEDDDRIFVTPGFVDDDLERVRHQVRDWIDDGMRSGGMSA